MSFWLSYVKIIEHSTNINVYFVIHILLDRLSPNLPQNVSTSRLASPECGFNSKEKIIQIKTYI